MSQSFEDSQQINVPVTSQYNWLGVLKFLQDQYKEQNFKDTEQVLEKQQQQEKIAQLEGELKAQENINKDLIKRIKMLEFSLRSERIQYQKLLSGQGIGEDIIKSVQKEEQKQQIDIDPTSAQVPQRKAKTHRPLLLKILEEVGIDGVFDEENEIIKANQAAQALDKEYSLRSKEQILNQINVSMPQSRTIQITNQSLSGVSSSRKSEIIPQQMVGRRIDYNQSSSILDNRRSPNASKAQFELNTVMLTYQMNLGKFPVMIEENQFPRNHSSPKLYLSQTKPNIMQTSSEFNDPLRYSNTFQTQKHIDSINIEAFRENQVNVSQKVIGQSSLHRAKSPIKQTPATDLKGRALSPKTTIKGKKKLQILYKQPKKQSVQTDPIKQHFNEVLAEEERRKALKKKEGQNKEMINSNAFDSACQEAYLMKSRLPKSKVSTPSCNSMKQSRIEVVGGAKSSKGKRHSSPLDSPDSRQQRILTNEMKRSSTKMETREKTLSLSQERRVDNLQAIISEKFKKAASEKQRLAEQKRQEEEAKREKQQFTLLKNEEIRHSNALRFSTKGPFLTPSTSESGRTSQNELQKRLPWGINQEKLRNYAIQVLTQYKNHDKKANAQQKSIVEMYAIYKQEEKMRRERLGLEDMTEEEILRRVQESKEKLRGQQQYFGQTQQTSLSERQREEIWQFMDDKRQRIERDLQQKQNEKQEEDQKKRTQKAKLQENIKQMLSRLRKKKGTNPKSFHPQQMFEHPQRIGQTKSLHHEFQSPMRIDNERNNSINHMSTSRFASPINNYFCAKNGPNNIQRTLHSNSIHPSSQSLTTSLSSQFLSPGRQYEAVLASQYPQIQQLQNTPNLGFLENQINQNMLDDSNNDYSGLYDIFKILLQNEQVNQCNNLSTKLQTQPSFYKTQAHYSIPNFNTLPNSTISPNSSKKRTVSKSSGQKKKGKQGKNKNTPNKNNGFCAATPLAINTDENNVSQFLNNPNFLQTQNSITQLNKILATRQQFDQLANRLNQFKLNTSKSEVLSQNVSRINNYQNFIIDHNQQSELQNEQQTKQNGIPSSDVSIPHDIYYKDTNQQQSEPFVSPSSQNKVYQTIEQQKQGLQENKQPYQQEQQNQAMKTNSQQQNQEQIINPFMNSQSHNSQSQNQNHQFIGENRVNLEIARNDKEFLQTNPDLNNQQYSQKQIQANQICINQQNQSENVHQQNPILESSNQISSKREKQSSKLDVSGQNLTGIERNPIPPLFSDNQFNLQNQVTEISIQETPEQQVSGQQKLNNILAEQEFEDTNDVYNNQQSLRVTYIEDLPIEEDINNVIDTNLEEEELEQLALQIFNNAATYIQKIWKGFQTRKIIAYYFEMLHQKGMEERLQNEEEFQGEEEEVDQFKLQQSVNKTSGQEGMQGLNGQNQRNKFEEEEEYSEEGLKQSFSPPSQAQQVQDSQERFDFQGEIGNDPNEKFVHISTIKSSVISNDECQLQKIDNFVNSDVFLANSHPIYQGDQVQQHEGELERQLNVVDPNHGIQPQYQEQEQRSEEECFGIFEDMNEEDIINWVSVQEKMMELTNLDDSGDKEYVIEVLSQLTLENRERLLLCIDDIQGENDDEDSQNFSIEQILAVFRIPIQHLGLLVQDQEQFDGIQNQNEPQQQSEFEQCQFNHQSIDNQKENNVSNHSNLLPANQQIKQREENFKQPQFNEAKVPQLDIKNAPKIDVQNPLHFEVQSERSFNEKCRIQIESPKGFVNAAEKVVYTSQSEGTQSMEAISPKEELNQLYSLLVKENQDAQRKEKQLLSSKNSSSRSLKGPIKFMNPNKEGQEEQVNEYFDFESIPNLSARNAQDQFEGSALNESSMSSSNNQFQNINQGGSSSSIFDHDSFKKFTTKKLNQIINEDKMNDILHERVKALELREQSQISAMKQMLNDNRVSPRTYNTKIQELESWGKKEREEIIHTRKAVQRSVLKAMESLKKTQRDIQLAQRFKESPSKPDQQRIFSIEDEYQFKRKQEKTQDGSSRSDIDNFSDQMSNSQGMKQILKEISAISPKNKNLKNNIKIIDKFEINDDKTRSALLVSDTELQPIFYDQNSKQPFGNHGTTGEGNLRDLFTSPQKNQMLVQPSKPNDCVKKLSPNSNREQEENSKHEPEILVPVRPQKEGPESATSMKLVLNYSDFDSQKSSPINRGREIFPQSQVTEKLMNENDQGQLNNEEVSEKKQPEETQVREIDNKTKGVKVKSWSEQSDFSSDQEDEMKDIIGKVQSKINSVVNNSEQNEVVDELIENPKQDNSSDKNMQIHHDSSLVLGEKQVAISQLSSPTAEFMERSQILIEMKKKWRTLNQIEARIAEQLHAEIALDKSDVYGISTNLKSLNDYLCSLFEYVVDNYLEEFIENLNTPFGFAPSKRLMLIHGYDSFMDSSTSYEQNGGGSEDYTTLPFVLSEELFIEFEQNIIGNGETDKEQIIKEFEHIHNKAIFDTFNEALNVFRPYYSLGGPPYSWAVSEKNMVSEKATPNNLQGILSKSKKKVSDWNSYLCGLVNDEEIPISLPAHDENGNPPPLSALLENLSPSNEYLGQVREEKLSKMLLAEIFENEYKWQLFEDEKTEVVMELSDLVFEHLVEELVHSIQVINNNQQE